MTSRDFCYWLQGLFELGNPTQLTPYQTDLVKRHLNMVFIHEIDPSFPAELQQQLSAAHSGRNSQMSHEDVLSTVHRRSPGNSGLEVMC